MSNHAKDLRKQLRAIVQEILPSFLSNEIGVEIQRRTAHDLKTFYESSLKRIEDRVKSELEIIAERQKEVSELLKAKIAELSKKDEGTNS